MGQLQKGVSLKSFNSFGLDVRAPELIVIREAGEVREAIRAGSGPFFVLGGGSNILWVDNPKGTLLKNEIQGITIVEEDDRKARLSIGGGVVWQELVEWTLDNRLGGLENLSLIPGTVGAAPIQNIGAYGVELEQVFHQLEAVSLATGDLRTFSREECRFGYRDSIFKRDLKGQFLISRVFLDLQKPPHTLQLRYGLLRQTVEELAGPRPGIRDVSRAVIRIRRSKLPDPDELGNAGSFFKNPELQRSAFKALQEKYPEVPHYPLADGRIKVPAGWLIEQAGWKGKREGPVGCYHKQALVIVNHGGATGKQVWEFARKVMASVEEKFSIRLQPEVNCL